MMPTVVCINTKLWVYDAPPEYMVYGPLEDMENGASIYEHELCRLEHPHMRDIQYHEFVVPAAKKMGVKPKDVCFIMNRQEQCVKYVFTPSWGQLETEENGRIFLTGPMVQNRHGVWHKGPHTLWHDCGEVNLIKTPSTKYDCFVNQDRVVEQICKQFGLNSTQVVCINPLYMVDEDSSDSSVDDFEM